MPRIPDMKSLPKSQVAALVIFTVLGLLHLLIVVYNHYNFRTYAFDYGVYNFAFFDFAHFRAGNCPIYLAPYGISFLQDHFSLTLAILSPLYWILAPITGSYTLLLLQWVFIITGAWATYRVIFINSGSYLLATCSMFYFFILYGRFSAYQNDCNLAIMGAALVPLFLYFFELKKYTAMFMVFVFLIFNREDFPLGLFFLCLFLALLNKDREKRKIALLLSALSVIFFILIFSVFIPALEDEHKQFSLFNYSALGSNPAEAFRFIITHPLKTLEMLFVNHTADPEGDGVKTGFYLIYLVSGAFVLLYRPLFLLPLIPLIGKKMLNDDPGRWGHESYHSVEILSLLPFLVFYILSHLRHQKIKTVLGICICLLAFGTTLYCFSNTKKIFSEFNKFDFLRGSYYRTTGYDVNAVKYALQKIPDEALVSASGRIVPHLAFRTGIYYFPRIDDAEYICVLTENDTYPLSVENFKKETDKLLRSKKWRLELAGGGMLLFKRMKTDHEGGH